jgi:hypothetical protein
VLLAVSLHELRALYPVAAIVIRNGMEPCATLATWGGLVLNATSQLASLAATGTVCALMNATATLGLVASFAPRRLPCPSISLEQANVNTPMCVLYASKERPQMRTALLATLCSRSLLVHALGIALPHVKSHAAMVGRGLIA